MGKDLTNMLANAAANRRDAAPAAPAPAPAPAKSLRRKESAAPTPPPAADGKPFAVPVEKIAFNPFNRRVIDLGDAETAREIKELAASLRKGQISPIAVITRAAWDAEYGTEHADKIGDAEYVQIPGGRRLTAAREHGIKTLEIVVKDGMAPRKTLLANTAVENLQRLDLSPLEEAEQLEDLLTAVDGKAADAAKLIGMSAATVSQRLDLIRLCPPLREEVRTGTMTLQQAREFLPLLKEKIVDENGKKIPRPAVGQTIPEADQLALWEAFKAASGEQVKPETSKPKKEPGEPSVRVTASMDPAAIIEALAEIGIDPAALAEAASAHAADQDDQDGPADQDAE